MEYTPNLSFPYILPSQAQKHVTHNEALLVLDALLHCAVEDRTLSEPPSAPAEGQRHLISENPAGEWSGRRSQIAAFQGGSWNYYLPVAGQVVFIKLEGLLLLHDGEAFRAPLQQTPMLGINSEADSARRLTVASDYALFTHNGTDHRLTVRKATTADTASLVFQDATSGRAEIGLAGDDDLHVKVSADGILWRDAVTVTQADGALHAHNGLSVERGAADSHQFGLASFYNPGGSAGKVTSIMVGKAAEPIQSAQFGFYYSGVESGAYVTNYGDSELTGGLFIRVGGNVGVGTSSPEKRLHVAGNVKADGTVQVGQFTLATLPTASTAGAGALAFVVDQPGGLGLMCSDGEDWRTVGMSPL